MLFFGTAQLARDLAGGRVSDAERVRYFIANSLFFAAFSYFPFAYSNAGWVEGILELVGVLVVTYWGIRRCYAAYGEHHGSARFVSDFVCLSLPVGLKVVPVAWLLYWLVRISYRELFWSLSQAGRISPDAVLAVDRQFQWLAVFVTVVGSLVVYYVRISRALGSMRQAPPLPG
jgi:hypothetical protein